MPHHSISITSSGFRGRNCLMAGGVLVLVCSMAMAGGRATKSRATVSRSFYEGQQLFTKIWEPGKPSPTGGDGLGPPTRSSREWTAMIWWGSSGRSRFPHPSPGTRSRLRPSGHPPERSSEVVLD